ncbi:hypothetical protein [Winogradskyella sp.]|uniref:hypothetical protein n=1 Tax=Winogradskyella sp. TaxID=1883156 RepID=UPI002630333D|nr:hypothetical protein [Winogradskyella sp.]
MNFLVIYAVILLLSTSAYLFSTNSLTLQDFSEIYRFLKRAVFITLRLPAKNDSSYLISEISTVVSERGKALNKSLKHLEFIGKLESYINKNEECLLSVDCLYELKESKFKTQVSVLESTCILSSISNKKAA